MNIYRHEFRMNLRSVTTWSIVVALVIMIISSLFASVASDVELLNEAMAQMPPELLQAFGMTGLDFSTVLGFYSFSFVFVQICLAIQAANYGFSLVSVEEADMTADFLLAKPVGRSKILTSKLLSAITGLAVTDAVVWVVSLVAINLFREGREYDAGVLIMLLLSIVVFQLFFLSVGLLISLLVKRVRSVTPYTMALVFGMYILNAFGGMLGEDTIEIITPFRHFDPNYIISNAAYDLPLVLLSVAVIVIAVALSYRFYTRRNIASAT